MIKAVVFDFSRVLLFPLVKTYTGSLNELHKKHLVEKNYSVFHYFQINSDLLTHIEKFKGKTSVYILTSDTIQESIAFAPYLQNFSKIYSAAKIGISKNDPRLYKWLCNDLKLEPQEILYIDDSEDNIKAATETKIQTIRYKGNVQVVDQLISYLKL